MVNLLLSKYLFHRPFLNSVVRSSGMFGVVVIQWQITPADTTTFPLTSGTGIMGNGELSLNMSIQV